MIKIRNLSFGYGKGSNLFSDLNLELHKGHAYGLLGKNGAGKTSLLKNIIGLVYPQKGSCEFLGRDTSLRSVEVLRDLYFIPEDFYFPALDSIKFAKGNAPFYPNFSQTEFENNLRVFEVDGKQSLQKQSFGQQKKALISFALATQTPLLMMDEPTNGLDIPSKAQFRKLVSSALTEEKTILISTHQVRDLENLMDTLIILNNQKIVVNEPLDRIAEKLLFTKSMHPENDLALYEEEGIRGKIGIYPNTQGEMSKVDLELFFNAMITGNKSILNILNTTQKESIL